MNSAACVASKALTGQELERLADFEMVSGSDIRTRNGHVGFKHALLLRWKVAA
jgi:hypothetical protein